MAEASQMTIELVKVGRPIFAQKETQTPSTGHGAMGGPKKRAVWHSYAIPMQRCLCLRLFVSLRTKRNLGGPICIGRKVGIGIGI